jgi:hypothetical protein
MNLFFISLTFTWIMFLLLALKHKMYFDTSKRIFVDNETLRLENEHLTNVLPNQQQELHREWQVKIQESVDELRSDALIAQTNLISQALTGDSGKELQSSMKTLIESTYSRMSQEFIGGLEDETNGLLADLNENLCDRVWDSIQQMKVQSDESPYILPPSAVIAYTKGIRTVVVVEQKPQVRTMGFTPDLVSQRSRNKAVSTSNQAYRFRLSFPYVYFFVAFDGKKFAYHEIYFRNKPLTSAREHVYNPPLPNIHKDKKNFRPMCMGEGFRRDLKSEPQISRACEEVISEFWQRPFNEHLGNGILSSTDNRVSNYSRWQAATEEDPMFILNVKWGKGKTVKSIMDEMFKRREMEHPSDDIDKKIRTMLDKGVNGINKTLKSAIDSAKKNNTLRAGKLDPVVKEQLENVVVSHTKKVFEHCIKT